MEYRINKKTGDKISVLGMGSGGVASNGFKAGVELLQNAIGAGINYFDLAAAEGVFVPLAGTEVHGYEIHMGRTSWSGTPGTPFLRKKGADPDADASDGAVQGNVCGTYLHGLFDAGNLAWRVADLLARKKGITLDAAGSTDEKTFRQSQYDLLADCVRNHMDMAAVYAMLREASI